MRKSTFIVSLGMVLLLVGCGLLDTERQISRLDPHPSEPDNGASTTPRSVPSAAPAQANGELFVTPTLASGPGGTKSTVEVSTDTREASQAHPAEPSGRAGSASGNFLYHGPSSLEKRVLKSHVIARVRLDSVSSTVESGPTYQGIKYSALLEFNFSVLEYLKGSGAEDIVAVWIAAPFFDTRQDAAAALPAIIADRDTVWDDHEAIVFLRNSDPSLASTLQSDRYYMAWGGGTIIDDDGYSIASRYNKLWLPADTPAGAPSQTSGDQQRFLTDVPPGTGTSPTMTLGETKTRVAAVVAKLNAGDGSEEYRECVRRTYIDEGVDQYRRSIGEDGYFFRTPDQVLASGLPSSSVVFEKTALGGLPNTRAEVWLEGGDAVLFNVVYGDSVPHDFSGDGVIDSIRYVRRIVSARPLPEGTYTTNYNLRGARFVRCDGYSSSHDWTITVTALEGTLHEAFFDPVTDGTAVAADDANGVLKPATLTDANGTSATIERISWESGAVKLKVSPHTGIAGHIVDIIALDGSVPLSLKVADATADAANDTLSWSVASQPWHDGDELMLRIREVPDCSNGTVVPNPSANPGLKRDCINLLAAKDTLRGTATLNWSEDTAITSWDGVRVKGSPGRVAEVLLTSKGLTGTIPPDLGRLDGLQHLWFNINQLAGAIPSELGSLASLQTLILNDNRLTGAVPRELGGLSSLETLWLDRNRLSGEIPAALGDLSSLRRLTLSVNRLSGSIPSDLGNLTNLEYLWLNVNRLTGTIPSELGSLDDLRNLRLGSNQLTGCIPPALRDVDDHDLNDLGLQNCPTP